MACGFNKQDVYAELAKLGINNDNSVIRNAMNASPSRASRNSMNASPSKASRQQNDDARSERSTKQARLTPVVDDDESATDSNIETYDERDRAPSIGANRKTISARGIQNSQRTQRKQPTQSTQTRSRKSQHYADYEDEDDNELDLDT